MNKLKEARERHGVTQQQLADALGITAGRYSQIEAKPERVRADQMEIICGILNENPQRIFFKKERKFS